MNYNWLKEKMIVLFKVLAAVNGAISLGLIILAPWIIKLLWEQNIWIVLASFRILAFNYFLSGTFRIPAGNILAMLKNVKVNLIVSVLAGTANIFLDIFLIQRMGSEGVCTCNGISCYDISCNFNAGFIVQSEKFKKEN
ncbi:MAG: hypothetical protein ACLTKE_07630 [Coprococcus sp.]